MLRLGSSTLALGLALATLPARADEGNEAAARAAYDEGATAYEAHEYGHAARAFARADELAPNPLVLKLALAAATQADDDPVLGMGLVLRAEARAVDGTLAELAKKGRARFAPQVAVGRVVCAAGRTCHAVVAGRSANDGELVALAPGRGAIRFTDGEHEDTLIVDAHAGVRLDLVEPSSLAQPTPSARVAPAENPATRHASASGLSPVFFWSGVVVSAALAGGTIASGLDTAAQHDAFLASPSADGKDRGQAAEVRTNVLLAATITTTLVTTAVGLFFTKWHGGDGGRVGAAPGGLVARF